VVPQKDPHPVTAEESACTPTHPHTQLSLTPPEGDPMIHYTGAERIDEEDAGGSEIASSFGGSVLSELPPTTSATLDLDLYVRLSGRRGGLHAAIALAQSRGELKTRDRGPQENASAGNMRSVVGRMALAQQQATEQVAHGEVPPSDVAARKRSPSASEVRERSRACLVWF